MNSSTPVLKFVLSFAIGTFPWKYMYIYFFSFAGNGWFDIHSRGLVWRNQFNGKCSIEERRRSIYQFFVKPKLFKSEDYFWNNNNMYKKTNSNSRFFWFFIFSSIQFVYAIFRNHFTLDMLHIFSSISIGVWCSVFSVQPNAIYMYLCRVNEKQEAKSFR